MSIIQNILSEEFERLEALAQKYEKEIEQLPKGSISRKARNGNIYIYLAYRDRNKVKFKYLGKESSEKVKEVLSQHEQGKKYAASLRQVKKDIKEIKKVLNGRKQ